MASDTEAPPSTCPVCLKDLENCDLGKPEHCHHFFCFRCILEWSKNVNTCPLDRVAFNHILLYRQFGREYVRSIYVPDHSLDDVLVDPEGLTYCEVCGECHREESLLLCDGCDKGYHLDCLSPPLGEVPEGNWYCEHCERIVYGANLDDMRSQSSPENMLQIVVSSSESEDEETTEEEGMSDETEATSSSLASKEDRPNGEATTSPRLQGTKAEHSASFQSGFSSDSSSDTTGTRRWRSGHTLRARDTLRPVVVVSTSSENEVDIDDVKNLSQNSPVTGGSLLCTRSPERTERSVVAASKSSGICRESPSVLGSSTSNGIISRRLAQSSFSSRRRRKVTRAKDAKKGHGKARRRYQKKTTRRSARRRRRRRKATKSARFLRARTAATHRTAASRVDQSIRQAVIASHQYARAEEGVRAAQKVVLEARQSTTTGWRGSSLFSTPFSSLTQNVCIPSKAGKSGIHSPSTLNNVVSFSPSLRKAPKLGNVFRTRSSSLPFHPPLANTPVARPRPKALNASTTERPTRKQGCSFPTQNSVNSASTRIQCSAPAVSRSVKTEGMASSASAPNTPTTTTPTRKAFPVQPPFAMKVKAAKMQQARDPLARPAKTSKPLPRRIERSAATDLLGTITKNLDDLQAKQCIFKRDGSIIPVHESPPLLHTKRKQSFDEVPEKNGVRDGPVLPVHKSASLTPTNHNQSSDDVPEENGIGPHSPHLSTSSKFKSCSSLETSSFHSDESVTDFKDDPVFFDPHYPSSCGPLNGGPVELSASDLGSYTMLDGDRDDRCSCKFEQKANLNDALVNSSLWPHPPDPSKCPYSTLEELAISFMRQHVLTDSKGGHCPADSSTPLSDSLANAVLAVANTAIFLQKVAQDRRISLSDHVEDEDDSLGPSSGRYTSSKASNTDQPFGHTPGEGHPSDNYRSGDPSHSPPQYPPKKARRASRFDCPHSLDCVQPPFTIPLHKTTRAPLSSKSGPDSASNALSNHFRDPCNSSPERPTRKARRVSRFDQPCSLNEKLFITPPNKATPMPMFTNAFPKPVSGSLHNHLTDSCQPSSNRPLSRFDQPCLPNKWSLKSPPTTKALPQPQLSKSRPPSSRVCHSPNARGPSKAEPLSRFDLPRSPDEHLFKIPADKTSPVPLCSNKPCRGPVSTFLDTSDYSCASSFGHLSSRPGPNAPSQNEFPRPSTCAWPQTALLPEPLPPSHEQPLPALVGHNGSTNEYCAHRPVRTVVPLPDPASLAYNQNQACNTVLQQVQFHLQSRKIHYSEAMEIRKRAFKKVAATKHLVTMERVQKLVDDYVEMYCHCRTQQ